MGNSASMLLASIKGLNTTPCFLVTCTINLNKCTMETPEQKDTANPIVPLLIGAAAGTAIAYFFASENSESGSKLSETLNKGWEALKEKAPFIEEEFNSLKDRILDTVKSNLKAETDHPVDEITEA